jgi:hypothetical protein
VYQLRANIASRREIAPLGCCRSELFAHRRKMSMFEHLSDNDPSSSLLLGIALAFLMITWFFNARG